MGRWDDDFERREREREEYRGDVFYEVWRSGGSPDYIDYERVRDHFYDGFSAEEAARAELRAMRPREPEPDYPEPEYEDSREFGEPY